jgi:hypothetical protein
VGLNTITDGLNSRGVLAKVVCVNDHDREDLIKRSSYPTRGCCAMEGKEKTALNIGYTSESVIRLMHRQPSIFRSV